MYKINLPPDDAKVFEVKGATVDFAKYRVNSIEYISFNTSDRGAPEPMQNALLGLNFIEDENIRLVMISHRRPEGLLTKLNGMFEYIEETLSSEDIAIEFYVSNKKRVTDLSKIDNSCNG